MYCDTYYEVPYWIQGVSPFLVIYLVAYEI